MTSCHRRTAQAIAVDVRAGRVSALDICRSAIAHIEQLGSERSGFTRIFEERALHRAKAIDNTVLAGLDPGPLAGVPFGVAEMFDVAVERTMAGAQIRSGARLSAADAKSIQMLERAGAILIGTQNMDEFGYGFEGVNALSGTSINPHDEKRLAGGACGGSAVAVASEAVPFSLGFDANGQLRVPAALCGIIGFKPTHLDFSRQGTYPFVPSLDDVGPLTRDLDDLMLVRDVLRDFAPEKCAIPRGDLRFGRFGGWFDQNLDVEFRTLIQNLVSAVGGRTTELQHAELARAAASLITGAEAANLHRTMVTRTPMGYEPATRDRFLAALLMPADDYLQAKRFQYWAGGQAEKQFEYNDVYIVPAVPGSGSAPLIEDPTIMFDGVVRTARSYLGTFTQPISLIGLPTLVVPLVHDGALPLGIQLVAAPGADALLFAAARQLFETGLVAVPKLP
ncbi:AtzE family amidohydrolase [Parasphingorhabdus sp.]|uniref:AtzE family amidohydrolase n=1 Tax=Parasphingorhabdus sp. TaxID=2709688 RepID=UPI003A930AAC